LESERENTARTRNTRLAAIRSFFRYVAVNEPAHALHCQRILAIPRKRYQKKMIEYLTQPEIEALVAAADTSSWRGRRDRTIILLLAQTGLRVSELTALRRVDLVLGRGAHVRCEGKGRKCRSTPLRREVVLAVKAWVDEQRPAPDAYLFPSSRGGRLSTDAAERLVTKHVVAARRTCPSLAEKNVTPHVLRHSAAMALLEQGVDRSVIALWLGHESVETTQMYLHADLKMKERALARTTPTKGKLRRYRPDDALMAYLNSV
jgi:site-specific recombinase XerD